MSKKWHNIHPDFELNGSSHTLDSLWDAGYSFIKEGAPFEESIGDFLLDWLSQSNTVQVHTSGSTGVPKKISLKKENMVNSALATGEFFGLVSGDSTLLCLPCEYIAGKMMLVRAMVLGLHIDCIKPSSDPIQDLDKSYDFAGMVPLQVENGLEKLGHIKTLLIGGAAVSQALTEKLKDVPSHIFETYGMTETITHIAAKKLSHPTEEHFTTLPDISIEQDERGCLVINAPKLSEETIITNDLVEIVDDKRFKWLGRYDNVINSGGVKLIPEQIEAKLASVISQRFFVAGVPDERLGEKMILIVEGELTSTIDEIAEAAKLSDYEKPKQIHQIDELKNTGNGKISRLETLKLLNF